MHLAPARCPSAGQRQEFRPRPREERVVSFYLLLLQSNMEAEKGQLQDDCLLWRALCESSMLFGRNVVDPFVVAERFAKQARGRDKAILWNDCVAI